jgi:hypothetical protein|tara:strand:+ start:139 stop:252 length:114 start_codon:yes stop_codon:yes gene_type:complete
MPKNIFAEFNKQINAICFPGFCIWTRRIKNTQQVNID